MTRTLSLEALERALELRDLTDPRQGEHAMQRIVEAIHQALAVAWRCTRQIHRASPLVTIDANYDDLGYAADGAARDARYTRYLSSRLLLRTQTSAMIPPLLRALALDPPRDLLLVCPGLVYRRDCIDRLHTGEPHQLDVWRVATARLTTADLREMIELMVRSVLPDAEYRCLSAVHPYTTDGLQVDVLVGGQWVEIAECGMASPALLRACGLDTGRVTGLAMGVGLDRLLMIRKGIDDIRLLRSDDPRVARQMLDLSPYRAVSDQPPIRRDLSVAVDQEVTAEEIGDAVREAAGEQAAPIESIEVISETAAEDLPLAARSRLGLLPGQKNVLLRVVIRHPTRTLTSSEANEVRNAIYLAVHRGNRLELATA